MKKYMSSSNSFNKASTIIALSIILGTVTYAWTGPGVMTPETGNTPAPVNVGTSLQEKMGSLKVRGPFTISGGNKGYSELTQSADDPSTLATKSYVDGHFPICNADQFLTYDGSQLLCKKGGSTSCASENSEFKQDGSYTVPNGLAVLAIDAVGGGGGGGGGDGGTNGQGSGAGGSGGNSGVVRASNSSVLVRANGGAGGSGEGDSCCTPGGPGNGATGQIITQLVQVTPGEVLNVKIGGGGGGGAGDYASFTGPSGGVGVHTGNSFSGVAGLSSWGGNGGYGTISTLKGGRGSDSGFDGNSPGLNGTSPSLSSGTGAGGAGSPADIYGYGGNGGDGGRVVVRTPTASELQAAGYSSACQ